MGTYIAAHDVIHPAHGIVQVTKLTRNEQTNLNSGLGFMLETLFTLLLHRCLDIPCIFANGSREQGERSLAVLLLHGVSSILNYEKQKLTSSSASHSSR